MKKDERYTLKTKEELFDFIKDFIYRYDLVKYKPRLGVVHYPWESHSKGWTDKRQYHMYECFFRFFKEFNIEKVAGLNSYSFGIYLKDHKLWVPLLNIGSDWYDSTTKERHFTVTPKFDRAGFSEGNIYEILTFPLKVRSIRRKLRKCETKVGVVKDCDYTKHIDKIINIKMLSNKI